MTQETSFGGRVKDTSNANIIMAQANEASTECTEARAVKKPATPSYIVNFTEISR